MQKLFSLMESALAVLGRWPARKLVVAAVCLVAAEAVCLLAYAAQTHLIVQRGRAFNVAEVAIAAGDTVEFNNEDDFIHQIYIQSPQLNFDSDEQPPGQIITVKFPSAGTYEVHCHIHPKMYLKVDVK
jgi:plastocyanin